MYMYIMYIHCILYMYCIYVYCVRTKLFPPDIHFVILYLSAINAFCCVFYFSCLFLHLCILIIYIHSSVFGYIHLFTVLFSSPP